MLRVRPSTVRRWARKGIIPVLRIQSKTVRFDARDVLDALAARRGVSHG